MGDWRVRVGNLESEGREFGEKGKGNWRIRERELENKRRGLENERRGFCIESSME